MLKFTKYGEEKIIEELTKLLEENKDKLIAMTEEEAEQFKEDLIFEAMKKAIIKKK